MAKKVLLVEYEPRYLQRLTSVLQQRGWEVKVAKDGEEALQILETYVPDLIFVSAVLPKIRTAEVIKNIKLKPELAASKLILLATGIKDDLIEVEKKKKGVDDILCKPFSETKIIECVDKLTPSVITKEEKKEEGILDLIEKPEKKLTSEDIFGEIIEEKPEGEVKKEKEKVEELLHKTLSSVSTEKPKKIEAAPKIDEDIDKKLTETLAGIQIPKVKKAVQIPKEEIKEEVKTPPEEPKKEEEVTERIILKEEKKLEVVPPPEEKEERFGNYILIEKLGTGGMAEIYKAKMEGVEGFQKLVAIKRILPQFSHNKDFTTMFIDEAKVAAQLSHRNIVHIYDLGKIENSYFIAMEYVEGTDLRKLIHEAKEKKEKIPIPIALFIASQVASALDYAHNKKDHDGKPLNIVHRDVSPQNILISKDGEIKICDFGIAKAASKASHTRAGSLKGKLQYMSPEQAWGKQIDFKSDLFSLGVVIYEMLTGKHLFEGDSELSILEKVRHPKFELPSKYLKDCPQEIDNLVEKALKENPEERYADASSMKKDIEEILSRYEPKVSEKTISDYLAYLEGKKGKFIEFKYKAAPKKEEKLEEVKPAEIPKPVEKEKEEAPLKPPKVILPEKKAPVLLEEERLSEKKFPMWIIGAAAAVILIIVGIFFLTTGKKPPAPVEEAKVEEVQSTPQEIKQVEEISPKKIEETPSTKKETKKQEEPIKEKIAEIPAEKKEPEAPKEVKVEKEEKVPPLPEKEIPQKQEAVEEVKKPEEVVETLPPPEPKIEPEKFPEKKEEVKEIKPKYKTGDLVLTGTPGLIAPRKINEVRPNYPPIAKIQKITGNVDVKVLVDENGNVIETTVISGHPVFHQEAINAAKKTKFAPAEIEGIKVKCYYILTFTFKFQ